MNCKIHVYLLNEHFSQEHADAHYNGEESENNLKYEWEDEFAITSTVESIVETHELIKDENGFTIKIFLKDFEPMSNPVPGIYVASKEFPQALVF